MTPSDISIVLDPKDDQPVRVSFGIFGSDCRCNDSLFVLNSKRVTECSEHRLTVADRRCSFIRELARQLNQGHRINGLASIRYEELLRAASGCRPTGPPEDFLVLCGRADSDKLILSGPTYMGHLAYRILGITARKPIFAAN